MIFILFITFFWSYIFITIKPGEVGILFKRFGQGTVVDHVYPEGLNIIFPWNKMYIYDTRVQQKKHEMTVLTKEGLKVNILVSIRYYPELDTVGVLHKRVGPEYVDRVVVPEVESILRVQSGHLNVDELYTPDSAILQKMVNDAIEQMEKNYITIQDVILVRMVLPKPIEEAIENKIEHKELAEGYQYRLIAEKLEAERKEIEAQGIKKYNDIVKQSISQDILKWQGIKATMALSTSTNAKVVIIGNSSKEMPIILGGE
ncbi:MAG: prohibitin family protein [Methylococcaceae bacterium]|nr:prohibitin family protein [Methylococcaceae bacterium]